MAYKLTLALLLCCLSCVAQTTNGSYVLHSVVAVTLTDTNAITKQRVTQAENIVTQIKGTYGRGKFLTTTRSLTTEVELRTNDSHLELAGELTWTNHMDAEAFWGTCTGFAWPAGIVGEIMIHRCLRATANTVGWQGCFESNTNTLLRRFRIP